MRSSAHFFGGGGGAGTNQLGMSQEPGGGGWDNLENLKSLLDTTKRPPPELENPLWFLIARRVRAGIRAPGEY